MLCSYFWYENSSSFTHATGTYGTVCSALHKETGTTRAIKELKNAKKNTAKNDLLLKVSETSTAALYNSSQRRPYRDNRY